MCIRDRDYIIEQFSNVPVYNMKPLIRNLLRMSVYQLKYMDSVPDSAACNEAVKLAQRRGFYNLKGFVNGVLRSTCLLYTSSSKSRSMCRSTRPSFRLRIHAMQWR